MTEFKTAVAVFADHEGAEAAVRAVSERIELWEGFPNRL